MAEELKVVLNRGDSGLGFSILGTAGLPPIIYDIVENSPAAESGEVEAGDVILKVNETDVNCFSTKEVLKCLRLSAEPITLKLKRDPVIKARVQTYLASQEFPSEDSTDFVSRDRVPPLVPPLPPPPGSRNGSHASNVDSFAEQDRLAWEPLGADKFQRSRPTPRFEAFMMTGDLILNLSRTQQGTGLLPKQQKKVDSLRCHQKQTHHNSVPSSPNESAQRTAALTSDSSSAGTSPVGTKHSSLPSEAAAGSYGYHGHVRTSRSEDHLQFQKDSMSAVDIDIDDDVTSSLHTLLDTRQDEEASDSADRIVWTYNAPGPPTANSSSASSSMSSSSPRRSLSPHSPTSVSSSVMSSNEMPLLGSVSHHTNNGDLLSQSEGVSNISSPDFQEEETLDILSSRDLMEVSDPSDSDSTLLVSDRQAGHGNANTTNGTDEHRIVIQVKGPEGKDGRRGSRSSGEPGTPELCGYQELRDCDEENGTRRDHDSGSPPVSEEESDLESLHSFHFHPKAVDLPSAERLAKRLYALDGFKKSDVSRHLSKNNEFSRTVADEYLRYFNFERDTLDGALRKFLKQFSLAGETQERERVLVHFSKRYLDCNPRTFNSQDAVHTLTCAIMLLNTDLHGQNIGRKMTCSEFVENLSELNDGENFPRDVLKLLYQAIKSYPLEWALDDEGDECNLALASKAHEPQQGTQGTNPFLDVPNAAAAIEHKKGYVMRKCCIDANGKKTVFGKRGWKMFYCTLRDMVLYLHKDEHGFRKNALADSVHNSIRIHHGLATKAGDYDKKQHVFRLQTCTRAEYLFQTSDSKELQSWIDTINLVCASFSAAPLEGAVGSQRRFQPPLLPCSHSKLGLRDQLRDHEDRVARMEAELDDHRRRPPERGSKALAVQNHREKDAYLHLELKRYKTYVYLLRSRLAQFPDAGGDLTESPSPSPPLVHDATRQLVPPPVPDRRANANVTTSRTAPATTTAPTPAAPAPSVANRKKIIYGED